MADTRLSNGATEADRAPAARRRSAPLAALGLLVYGAGTVTLVAAVALFIGFGWFALSVADREEPVARPADGIVVLTGGASRIADGIELLSQQRGRRMLISGVHPQVSLPELIRQAPVHRDLFACCVDLGYAAQNTIGNAVETRQWIDRQGFRSIIVVTSSYHMRRALSEIRRQAPDADLIPFPVISETMALNPWWTSLETTQLLFGEYVKYIVALLRMRLEDWPSAATAQLRPTATGS